MEKKRYNEEKRYAILSQESVRYCAEAGGHTDLPNDVLSLLAEDVIYRLREATHSSCQYMRHSKRRRLTTEHFNKALSAADVPVICGSGTNEVPNFLSTKDGEIHFEEDPEVNLINLVEEAETSCPKEPTKLTASWLAVEGIPVPAPGSEPNITDNSKLLDEDQRQYYEHIIRAIFSSDVKLIKRALDDMRTNPRLSSILSHLVNFISTNVKLAAQDITRLTQLLQMIHSLLKNKTLFLEPSPYLKVLIQSVTHCLLETFTFNPHYDHWRMRDLAAKLLPLIALEWNTPLNGLTEYSLQILKEAVTNHDLPFATHYGAITALTAFGPKALEETLLPHLNHYWHHLSGALSDTTHMQAYMDAHKVYGAIMLAGEILIKYKSAKFFTESQDKPSLDQSHLSAPVLSPVVHDITEDNMDEQQRTTADGNSNEGVNAKSDEGANAGSVGDMHFTHHDLLGPVLELPGSFTSSSYSLTEVYLQFADRFGDSLVARLPYFHHIPVPVYDVPTKPDTSNDLVQLGNPEDKKTGEEYLNEMLNDGKVSRQYNRIRGDMDIDYDFEDRSDRSSRSEHSDLLNFLGDDTDLTVKNIEQSHGIKLIFSKKPKSKPTPESEHGGSKTPSASASESTAPKLDRIDDEGDVSMSKEPEHLDIRVTKTIVNQLSEDTDDYVDESSVFEGTGFIQQRRVVFQFIYTGISRECEYVEKRRITIDLDNLDEREHLDTLHDLCNQMPPFGRPVRPSLLRVKCTPHVLKQRQWRRKLFSCCIDHCL